MSEREDKAVVKRQMKERLSVLRIYLRRRSMIKIVRFDGAAVSLSAMELA